MSPLVLLLGSLGFSLAFNISWAWGGPPLSVIAAAACTLIVPAGLHLWPQIPARRWQLKALRALVMTGICSAAAVSSFSHAVSVLLAAGWTDFTAWSVTGGAELLVALSTMALRTPAQVREQDAAKGAEQPHGQRHEQEREQAPEHPVRTVADVVSEASAQASNTPANTRTERPTERPTSPRPRISVVAPDRSEDFHRWVSTLAEKPSNNAIRNRYGCGYKVAERLLAELDDADSDDEEATG